MFESTFFESISHKITTDGTKDDGMSKEFSVELEEIVKRGKKRFDDGERDTVYTDFCRINIHVNILVVESNTFVNTLILYIQGTGKSYGYTYHFKKEWFDLSCYCNGIISSHWGINSLLKYMNKMLIGEFMYQVGKNIGSGFLPTELGMHHLWEEKKREEGMSCVDRLKGSNIHLPLVVMNIIEQYILFQHSFMKELKLVHHRVGNYYGSPFSVLMIPTSEGHTGQSKMKIFKRISYNAHSYHEDRGKILDLVSVRHGSKKAIKIVVTNSIDNVRRFEEGVDIFQVFED